MEHFNFQQTGTPSVHDSQRSNQGVNDVELELDSIMELTDVSHWALDATKTTDVKPIRSMSVQIAKSSDLEELHALRLRRSSTAVSNRRQSESIEGADMKRGFIDRNLKPGPGRIDSAKLTRQQSEPPTLGTMSASQSLAKHDGVQLRGDKGKARRKSPASSSRSHQTKLPPNNEWKRIFNIHYTPRQQKRPQVEPEPPSTLPNLVPPKSHSEVTISSQSEKPWRSTSAVSKTLGPIPETKNGTRIHYEDYLPKDSWVELKPKQFTRNHRHGNHFEQRRSLSRSHQNRVSSRPASRSTNERKDMYVWENPHQIWLMEKTVQLDEAEAR